MLIKRISLYFTLHEMRYPSLLRIYLYNFVAFKALLLLTYISMWCVIFCIIYISNSIIASVGRVSVCNCVCVNIWILYLLIDLLSYYTIDLFGNSFLTFDSHNPFQLRHFHLRKERRIMQAGSRTCLSTFFLFQLQMNGGGNKKMDGKKTMKSKIPLKCYAKIPKNIPFLLLAFSIPHTHSPYSYVLSLLT